MNRLLFWKTAYGYQSVDMAMCFLVKVEKDQKSWKLAIENGPKYHSESVRLPLAKVSTANDFLQGNSKLLKDQSELALCDAGWTAE